MSDVIIVERLQSLQSKSLNDVFPPKRLQSLFQGLSDRLQLTLGLHAATLEQLPFVEDQFPLNAHVHLLCKVGSAFNEPLNDDIPTPEPELQDLANE
ncbi:hypothetical protein RND71_003450 [Anisodus tanguticus]|uniref:Uncharacterized protein n=1 Tax=Anisodus tanguticus TaxID=243964 RepID=A0AAE1VWN9_9SOLA|nr:hypothetical protein RND71_003450 [Anisodus tanguticus]